MVGCVGDGANTSISRPARTHALHPHISTSLSNSLQLSSNAPLPQPRPNTKWSKIIINGVPTGTLADRSPLLPDECHRALTASNPTYTALTIMQKPSWVRPPTSYTPGSVFSLSVAFEAFEDPDSSKLKVLLAEHYLYAFRNRASVHKWKYHQKSPKSKSKSTTSKHPNTGDANNEEDINQLLSTPATLILPTHSQTASAPPVQSSQPTCKSNRTTKPTHPFDA